MEVDTVYMVMSDIKHNKVVQRGILTETIQADEMTLYPNPVQNELTIADSEELASVQIYSLTGENFLIQTEMSSDKIDVSQLESGIYVCVMETISGEILQAKFIKN